MEATQKMSSGKIQSKTTLKTKATLNYLGNQYDTLFNKF